MTKIPEEFAELMQAIRDGKLTKQGRGRPRKGSTAVRWRDLGLTRQQVWEWLRLAQIPGEALDAYFAKSLAEEKRPSTRGLLIQFGLRNNVANDDVFAGTPTGELAEALLAGFERIVPELTRRQRRSLIRAMRNQMRVIDLRAEMNEDDRE
jgi:hypothetical protein